MTLIKAITFENFDYMILVEDILPGLEQDLNTAMENVEDPEALFGSIAKFAIKQGIKHVVSRRRRRRRRRRRCKETLMSYLIYFIHPHGHKKCLLKKNRTSYFQNC